MNNASATLGWLLSNLSKQRQEEAKKAQESPVESPDAGRDDTARKG